MNFFIEKVFAAGNTPDTGGGGICNPVIPALCGSNNAGSRFASLFSGLLGLFLVIATIFAFINLLQGGISWITSGGDKTALDSARDRIQNALLGMLIVFSAWVIFILLLTFLGISKGGFIINLPSLFPQQPSQ